MSVEEDKRGKKVRCRKCEALVPVPAKARPSRDDEEEYDEIVEEEAPAKKKKPAPRDEDDEVEEVAPVKKKRRGEDDDEGIRDTAPKKVVPAKPQRRRDDDYEDEDDKPRGKKGKPDKQKSPAVLIGIIAAAAVLVVGGGGIAAYYAFFNDDTKTAHNTQPLPSQGGPAGVQPPGGGGATQPSGGGTTPQTPPGSTGKSDGGTKPAEGTKPDGGGDVVPVVDSSKVSRNQIYQYVLKSTAWVITKQAEGSAMGTGSLIDRENRLVLTNYHVVHGLQDFVVFFPTYDNDKHLVQERKVYMARARADDAIHGKVVGHDKVRDMALIQLNRVPDGIDALPIAKEPPGSGEDLHSIGNPGVSDNLWVYTHGNVRGVGEKTWDAGGHGFVLHLKAKVVESSSPTNPGDSGGPCCNDRGELVGVTQGGMVGIGVNAISYFICCTEAEDFINRAFKGTPELAGKSWVRSKRPPLDKTGGGSKANLPALITKLNNPTNPQARAEGANGLGLLGPDAQMAIPFLVKALADQDDLVKQFASEALKSIGAPNADQVPRLIPHLQLPSAEARGYVLGAIALLGASDDAAAPVLAATTDGQVRVRQQAMRALGKLAQVGAVPDKDAGPALERGLQDADKKVRGAAAEAITTDLPSVKGDVPKLVALLKNKQPEVSAPAATALGRLGEKAKAASPDLIEALKTDDGTLRRACLVALKSVKADPAAVVPQLRGPLLGEDVEVRRAALELAKEAGPAAKGLAPVIADALSDADVRREALLALEKIGPDAASGSADAVARLLATDKPLRLEALAALEAMKVTGSTAELIVPRVLAVFADEQREPVKEKTAAVLSRMGKSALKPLTGPQGLGYSSNAEVRKGAARSLGGMGSEARPVVPALQVALNLEKDKAVQEEIGAAIQRIANSK
jgi:HEAT repeat protein